MMNLNSKFLINKKIIKNFHRPYIIAEIGSNFDQSFVKAKKYVDIAKKIGADCVKFQLFKASDLMFKQNKSFKIFERNELSLVMLKKIFNYTKKKKIDLICSCFNPKYIDYLEKLNLPAHKVASSELLNIDLLKKVANTKKPIILSSGMANEKDVILAIKLLKRFGAKKIALLQCTSNYPTKLVDINLNVIDTYSKIFNNMPIGLSDHTTSVITPALSISKGACIIEKHLTLNNKGNGPDHFYALNPKKFKEMINLINYSFLCNGIKQKKMHFLEKKNGRKKSLFYNKNLAKNKKIRITDLTTKNDNRGISPRFIENILYKKLRKKVYKDNMLKTLDYAKTKK